MPKPQIAIMTFVHAYNYGAELQCFALQEKLSQLGYDVTVLDLFRPGDDEYKNIQDHHRFDRLFSYNDNKDKKVRLKIVIARWIDYIVSFFYTKRAKKRDRAFREFHNQYTRLSEEKYYNFQSLYDKAHWPYSHFIVGSDQVWNYSLHFSNEPYFLTFVKNGKKISYAASIGHSDMPDKVKELYKKWLSDFDYISLREQQGVSIVKEITHREDVQCVLDPVLLFGKSDWIRILDVKTEKEKYVLLYLLSRSQYSVDLAKSIAKEYSLKVVLITTEIFNPYPGSGINVYYGRSPKDFVYLFANASFVVTNSFHGTAFAVNFNIPFFSTTRADKRYNSRFISLLENCKLSDRLLYEGQEYPRFKDVKDVSFITANTILERDRDKSLSYLLSSIEK